MGGVGYAAGTQTTEPLSGSAGDAAVCASGVRLTTVAATIGAIARATARRCTDEIILPANSLLDATIRRARMLRQVGRSLDSPVSTIFSFLGLEESTCPQVERSS